MKLRPLSPALIVLALTTISAATATAQIANKQVIRQQLEHKVFLLRGRWVCEPPASSRTRITTTHKRGEQPHEVFSEDKGSFSCNLSFGMSGTLANTAVKGPLTLSAVQIDQVQFQPLAIVLQGKRRLILREDKKSEPSTIQLQPASYLRITVALNPAQPEALQSALKRILAPTLEDALASESARARQLDLASLPVLAVQPGQKPSGTPPDLGLPRRDVAAVAGNAPHFSPPRPVYLALPRYTREARKNKVQGVCDISITVTKDGFPEHLRVVHSLPDGLDERAIAAVSQYRFHPGLHNGKPVAMEIIVEVDFRLLRRFW